MRAALPTTPTELARRATRLERPGEALAALAVLRARLETLEQLHVENARRAGWSWRGIAEALGVSKQALHKKHAARLVPRPRRGVVPRRPGEQVVVTGQARRAVAFARQEARALGQSLVGTGHLLLGVLRDAEGLAARALSSLGISLPAARDALERLMTAARIEAPRDEPERLPISRATRRALEQSLREAVARGDGHLGVEHVLLALLREPEAASVRVLGTFGVSPELVERRVDELRDAERNVRLDA